MSIFELKGTFIKSQSNTATITETVKINEGNIFFFRKLRYFFVSYFECDGIF
jgi:hypothetical protein